MVIVDFLMYECWILVGFLALFGAPMAILVNAYRTLIEFLSTPQRVSFEMRFDFNRMPG